MAAARRESSVISLSDTSDQLYTLVEGVTGRGGGEVVLKALSSLMYVEEFSQALKAGDLSDMAVLSPGNKLNSSTLLDETILESTKAALSAPSDSYVLRKRSNSSTLRLRNFETWLVIIYRLTYLPIGVYFMKLTWSLESNTALHGSGSFKGTM